MKRTLIISHMALLLLLSSGTQANGAALSLDGVNDWVSFLGTGVPIGGSSFTIGAWINPDVHGDKTMTFWGNQSGNNANGFRLRSGNATRQYFWGNDHDEASGDLSPNTGGPNADGWHHLSVSYDGSQTIWYLNGAQLGSPDPTGAGVNVANANFRIGSRINAEYFDGLLDEITIWDSALSAATIASGYNQDLDGTESGLVAYWDFENGGLTDVAGGNNNLTLLNGAFIDTGAGAPVEQDGGGGVPEPATAVLGLLGLGGLVMRRRRAA